MLEKLLLPVSLVAVVFWSNPLKSEERPAGTEPADAPIHTLELNDDEGSTELVHFFRRHYYHFHYYPRFYGYYHRHFYYRPYFYYPRYYYRPYYGYAYYYSYPAFSYYSYGYYGCSDDASVAVPTIPLVDECLPAPNPPQPQPGGQQNEGKGAAPVVPGPAPKEQPQPKAGQDGARPRVPIDGHLVSTEASQPRPVFGGSGFAAPAPRQTRRVTGFASDR